jgi:hypothetical protein
MDLVVSLYHNSFQKATVFFRQIVNNLFPTCGGFVKSTPYTNRKHRQQKAPREIAGGELVMLLQKQTDRISPSSSEPQQQQRQPG